MMRLFPGSFSQSGQESFVLNMLDSQKNGFYVEIGAYHSTDLSNTYVLESQYDWRGLAFEIDRKKSKEYNGNRKNKCITADATKFDYLQCFNESKVPSVIEYLQVDIEPAFQSLAALKRIPFDAYQFKVITFEHDLYSDQKNNLIQQESHEFLESFGYQRVVKNVSSNGFPYEDWYIKPELINQDILLEKLSSDVEWSVNFSI